jgi:tetratricopeptide (TPR) repeat protein
MLSCQKNISFQSCFQRSYSGTLQHPRYVVEQLNILALSHMYNKEYEQSESNLKKSLKICEFHTNVADNSWSSNMIVWTLNSLAQLEQSRNNTAEALKFIVQINEITTQAYEKNLTPLNAVISGLCRLGEVQFALGNYDAAEKEFNRIIDLDKKSDNCITEKISKASAYSLLYLGKIELEKENFEKARLLLERSWELYRHIVGILNVHIFTVLAELGKAYKGVGDFARARTLLEYAGQGFETFLHDQEKTESITEVWKEVVSHLPGVKGVRSMGPFSGRNGIELYPLGESPEEDKKRKEKYTYKKELLTKWKKAHNIKKFESNE